MLKRTTATAWGLALACLLLLAACRRPEVAVYRTAKEPVAPPPPPPAAEPPADTGLPPGHPPLTPGAAPTVAAAPAPPLAWRAPATWEARPAGGFRLASFAVPGAAGQAAGDVSLSVLAGEGGGLLANVNRWRAQLSLPPWSEGEFATGLERLATGLGPALLVACEGTAAPASMPMMAGPVAAGEPAAVLGALVPAGGRTWFVKLAGPPATVAAARGDFVAFVQSLAAAEGQAP